MPLGRIFAAVMRSNAMVQGQEQAKKIASDQMDSASKMSVTMHPNPSGGPPLVSLKNAPADLLNQTQGSDIRQAHDTPAANVEQKLAGMGFVPKDTNITPDKVDTFAERYSARQQLRGPSPSLGGSIFGAAKSALMAGLTGGRTDQALREHLQTQNAAENAATYQKFVMPIEQMTQQEARTAATSTVAKNQKYLSERDRLLNDKNIDQYPDAASYIADVNQAMAPVGGLAPGDEGVFKSAFEHRRVSAMNERHKALAGPEGRTAIESYKPNELDKFAAEQYGTPLDQMTDFQRGKVTTRFTALQDQKIDTKLTEAKKLNTLGAAASPEEAKAAMGINYPVSKEQDAQISAAWKVAHNDYQLADTRKKQEIEAAHATAVQKNNMLNPPEIKAGSPQFKVAQDLAYGKLTMQQFARLYSYSRDANAKLALYQKATELNPNFDPAKFELGYKFAGNAKIRQQVSSADNAIALIPEAIDISDKATRLGSTALNKLIIKGGVAMGGKKYTDFSTMQTAFADEISGALGFGSATDMTRELGLKMTDLSLSSPNFRSSMRIVGDFLEKKRGALVNQMGTYGPAVDEFSKGAAQAPGGGEVISLDDALKTLKKRKK